MEHKYFLMFLLIGVLSILFFNAFTGLQVATLSEGKKLPLIIVEQSKPVSDRILFKNEVFKQNSN